MSTKEFVAVNWSANQVIDEDTMDKMQNNITYLRNQMVDGKYTQLNGGVVDLGIKMLCGRKQLTPRASDTATVRIGFAKMFTPDSTPIVTTSIVSPGEVRYFSVINGINRLHPNHLGFECKVNLYSGKKKPDKLTKSIFINWMAMGY